MRRLKEPSERVVEVDIVSALPEPPVPVAPAPPVETQVLPPSAATEPMPTTSRADEPARNTQPTVKPSRMLSGAILADPRSRKALATASQLGADERAEQLCDLEAMAQIEVWNKSYKPGRVVAYAMRDTRMSGNAFLAEGAAFFSKGQWYNIAFNCGLAPDHHKVSSFEFRVGAAIPRKEWDEHGLSADGGDLD